MKKKQKITELDRLRKEKTRLQNEIRVLGNKKNSINNELTRLHSEVSEILKLESHEISVQRWKEAKGVEEVEIRTIMTEKNIPRVDAEEIYRGRKIAVK